MTDISPNDGSEGSDGPGPSGPRFTDELTLFATFVALGITLTVALVDRGVDTSVIIVRALVVMSATSELAFLAVDDAGGSLVAGVLSGWLVASRFGILAITLSRRLDAGPLERTGAALVSFDPNIGLMLRHDDPAVARRVFWRITAALLLGWAVGTVIGLGLGNVLGDTRRLGIDVVFPAVLLAIVGNLLRRTEGRAAAALGVVIYLLTFPWAPPGVPILASAIGAVVVAIRARPPGPEDTASGARKTAPGAKGDDPDEGSTV